MPVEDSYERWRHTYRTVDWEETYSSGRWDYLADIGELPRYGIVAGYLHKLIVRGRVLDAGCGEAILVDYLDLGRFEYTGFDLSATAVGRAQARLRGGTAFVGNIEEFEPPQGVTYDAVVFNESLQGIATPLESLDRYRRVLTEGGVMVVSLFKNPVTEANGPRLARFLTAECARGRYSLVDEAEAVSLSRSLAWHIYVLK